MKSKLSRIVIGVAGVSIALTGLALPASGSTSSVRPLFPPPAPDIQKAAAKTNMTGSTVQSGCGGVGGAAYVEADGSYKGPMVDGGSLQTPLNGTLSANVTSIGGSGVGSPWVMTGTLTLIDANNFPVFTNTPFTFPATLTPNKLVVGRGEITPLLYGTYELLANVSLTADLSNNTLTGVLGSPTTEQMFAVEWNGQTCNTGSAPDVQRAGAKFSLKLHGKVPTTKCPGLQQHLTTTVSPANFAGSQSDSGSAPIPLTGPLSATVGYTLDTVTKRAIMHVKGTKSTVGAALGYTFDYYMPATRGGGAVTGIGELTGALGASGYTLYANAVVTDASPALSGGLGQSVLGAQRLLSHEWNLGFCAPF